MIPDFDQNGNLPPGVHWATWDELHTRFGTNEHRLGLLEGLRLALELLKEAGCRTVYLNGSFVTSKELPNDFDACWDLEGADLSRLALLEPAFFDFRKKSAAQKQRFGGEFFGHDAPAAPGQTMLEFFQSEKDNRAKGIIAIDLQQLGVKNDDQE